MGAYLYKIFHRELDCTIMETGKAKSAVWASRLEPQEPQWYSARVKASSLETLECQWCRGSLLENSLLLRDSFRISTDWMRSTHIMVGHLLYSVFTHLSVNLIPEHPLN